MRAWYIYREIDINVITTILVSFACLGYLLIFYFLLYIPIFDKHYNTYIIIFLIFSVIAYLIIMFTTKTKFMSTLGFYGIIEISFIFAMSTQANHFNHLFGNITVSSYSALIVAIIVLLAVLEVDSLDGLDIGGGDINISSPKDNKVDNKKDTWTSYFL
jgi:hypothetical protein